jgi:tryptophan synthase alpha chain
VRAYNSDIPIGLLLYYNTILSQGVDNFYKQASAAGVDSILIADLPADSADEIAATAEKHHIAPVFIISPLTDDARLQTIAQVARAYIYVVSRLGITGTHEGYDKDLQSLLQRARSKSKLPLCVGFGISTPEQAKRMIEMGADGVITGSRVIQMMQDQFSPQTLKTYVQSMVEAIRTDVAIAKTF